MYIQQSRRPASSGQTGVSCSQQWSDLASSGPTRVTTVRGSVVCWGQTCAVHAALRSSSCSDGREKRASVHTDTCARSHTLTRALAHTHTHTDTCARSHTHTLTQTYAFTHEQTHTLAQTYAVHTRANTLTDANAFTHEQTPLRDTHTHSDSNIRIHTRANTHTDATEHTHSHTSTHTLSHTHRSL